MHIEIFERIIELLLKGRLRVLHIRNIHVPVCREGELGCLGHHLERNLRTGNETVGHSGIISPEHKVEGLEPECQLVIFLRDLSLLIELCGKHSVDRSLHGLLKLHIAVICSSVRKVHRHLGRSQDTAAVLEDRIEDVSVGQGDFSLEGTVRRNQFIVLWCSIQAHAEERCSDSKYKITHHNSVIYP